MRQLIDIQKTAIPERFKHALQLATDNILKTELPGLIDVYLFGSLARSSITSRSDIDICVVFSDDTDYHADRYIIEKANISSSAEQLEIDIDVIFCSVTTFNTSSKPIFKSIRRDGIHLLTCI